MICSTSQILPVLVLALLAYSRVVGAGRIACPPGWVSDNGKFPDCKACPPGSYQDKSSRKTCKSCPPHTTTLEHGADNKNQCIAVNSSSSNITQNGRSCDVGTYSTSGYSPCAPCGIGYYSFNTTTCKKCPNRSTTISVRAVHRRNCTKNKLLVPCPKGSISPSGYQPCSTCPIGSYQPYARQRVCVKCPAGLSNDAEGGINCTNKSADSVAPSEQEYNETTFTHTKVKYQKLKGVKVTKLNEVSGFFSSEGFPNNYSPGTLQQWKVHCFKSEYVGIIIAHMDLSEGDYLQVKDDRCQGKIPRPTSRVIRKSSVGVAFSGESGNSTGIQCAFLCIEHDKRAWAESVLYNKKIMDVIKNSTVAIEKAIDLILNPLALLTGFSDPYQRQMLQINFNL